MTDRELKHRVENALEWEPSVDAARIGVSARTVHDLTGVKGVTNGIALKPHVQVVDVRIKILDAFRRSAEIDARRINVTATDGKVILSGNVRTWAERQEAERAAWAAPGVTQVDDLLTVVP